MRELEGDVYMYIPRFDVIALVYWECLIGRMIRTSIQDEGGCLPSSCIFQDPGLERR